MIPRRYAVRAAPLLLAGFLAGCASSLEQPTTSDPFRSAGRQGDESVLLTVENHDFRDATIYGYWNGMKDRVGTVTGKTKKTFEMRWKGEEFQIEVDFLGGGGHWSSRIPVYEGDHINYVIQISGG